MQLARIIASIFAPVTQHLVSGVVTIPACLKTKALDDFASRHAI